MAVIAAILLARVFSPEKLDDLFERTSGEQYTQDLLFSTVFDLTGRVVCAIEPSIHSAYQSSEDIGVSSTAVYDKLSALEPGISAELVRQGAKQLAPITRALRSEGQENESAPWLESYRVKVLDGSCIEATERRIGELRDQAAAPLPGKALAVLDPEVGLITDFFPCSADTPRSADYLVGYSTELNRENFGLRTAILRREGFYAALQGREPVF